MTTELNQAGAPASDGAAASPPQHDNKDVDPRNADLIRRLKELETTAAEVHESRRAALNVLEDVVEQQRRAEEFNRQLQAEIIERKQAQEAQRRSEQRLQRVLETDAVGVLFFDHQGTVIDANDAFLRMTGYTREQIQARELSWRSMTPPEWSDESDRQMKQLLRTGRFGPYEKQYFLADGTRRWMLFAGRNLGDGTVSEYCIDITPTKQAEAALREREHELETIINRTPFLLTRCSRDLRYRYVSRAYAEMVNRPAAELAGQSISAVMGEEGFNTIRPHIERVLRGEQVQYESDVSIAGVGVRTLHAVYQPDRDPAGEIVGWIASILDVTERKRAEEALRETQQQLARELSDTKQLQAISALLIEQENTEAIYQHIVEAATRLMKSDAASIQMLDSEKNELRLLAWKGFHPESAKHWQWVTVENATTCGAALRYGERLVVPDISKADFIKDPKEHEQFRLSGIVAVQSTPLVSRAGHIVGMLSTHWSRRYQPTDRDLALLDVLARQAADVFERMGAEEALRKSEQTLRGVANVVPDLLWISEPDGSTSWCNERTLQFTGLSMEGFCGWGWTALIHPDDLEQAVQDLREAIKNASSLHREHRIRNAAGEYRWFLLRGEPVCDSRGNLVRMYGAATDIHDLRSAAEIVRNSEQRFQRVLEIGTVGVTFFDLSGRILSTNSAFRDLIGATEEELASGEITYHSLSPPDWEWRNEQTFKELLESGESTPAEKEYLCKDGSRIWVYCASKKLPDNTAVEFVLDITKRRRAEQELAAKARQQQALFEFARRRNEVQTVDELYELSLETITNALGCDRASILLFDHKNVMQFVAWRSLSAYYRRRAHGHSPWTAETQDPQPLALDDVAQAQLSTGLKHAIKREGIRALAFIPLVADDKLIGKFMTYYDAPHHFTAEELGLARTVADQLAHAVSRMQTEMALREANERFRLLVEGAQGYAIFMVNPSNIITHWNTGAERVFGWTAEEAIGKSGRIIFTPSDRKKKQEEKEIAVALRGGQAADRRWHVRKDGTRIWVDGVMHRIDDDATGALRGFAKIARDATADRRIHEELERRVQERTAELTEANRRLRTEIDERSKLEQKVIRVSEREIRRIGDDLHDSLCQELAATAFFLETQAKKLEKKNAGEASVFAQAARQVNANVGLARDLARGLHPVDLQSGGIVQALKDLAFRTSQYDIACRCECPGTVRVADEAIALNLYRIAAEAVGNALKHARARNIILSLKRARSGLVLQVRDDGDGIAERVGHRGMGLDIMRHRANVLGAKLEVQSRTGRGTTVTCTLPGE